MCPFPPHPPLFSPCSNSPGSVSFFIPDLLRNRRTWVLTLRSCLCGPTVSIIVLSGSVYVGLDPTETEEPGLQENTEGPTCSLDRCHMTLGEGGRRVSL